MKTGPKPRCLCGRCELCRRRESALRHYHGRAPLNPLRFRQPTLNLPDDPALIGYLAGLLDGEGCITKQNGRWRIQIAMIDEPLMMWLGELGGTVRERSVKGNRQRCWRWLLMRQIDVWSFLLALRPYLRVKADRADEVLAEIARDDLLVEHLNREQASARQDELLALERLA